jgi:hydrogenase expression/formation protein HypC
MCLGICGRVVGFVDDEGLVARVDVAGAVRDISLAIVAEDGVAVGDWLLIHMGVATDVIDEHEAAAVQESLELLGPGGQTPGWSGQP